MGRCMKCWFGGIIRLMYPQLPEDVVIYRRLVEYQARQNSSMNRKGTDVPILGYGVIDQRWPKIALLQ